MNKPAQPVVLMVDDSQQDVALVREACSEVECPVDLRAVDGGRVAMDYLEGRPPFSERAAHPFPALILLDLQMPGVSGFDVLTWLRKRSEDWRRTPVVVLTTSHDAVDVRRAYDLGANSFLVKPTGFAELAAAIDQVVTYWIGRNRSA